MKTLNLNEITNQPLTEQLYFNLRLGIPSRWVRMLYLLDLFILCHSVISDLVTGIVGMIETSIHYCTGGYLLQGLEGVVCLESTGDTLCSCISDLIER